MTNTVPGSTSRTIAVSKELDRVMRLDRGRLIAALAAGLRDLSLAEDVLQEAAVSALKHWGRSGLPRSPQGWLLQVARRKAIDRLRSAKRSKLQTEALAILTEGGTAPDADVIPDHRLRLIFACCHPALEPKSRVALTLRTVCGLTTVEIGCAFLDNDTTMGQRLSRAKAKISAAGIPFAVPDPEIWPARLDAVLTTVYLIFTTGYIAGPNEPRDLCLEAEYLMRLIDQLHPDDAEIEGAMAMMLLTAARRAARIGDDGASLPPTEQDRTLWDSARITEGRALLARAAKRRNVGPFQIKAAIADCQMVDPAPDWPQIAALYRALWQYEPTSVVALNSAVAMAEAGQAEHALDWVESLADQLSNFQPWHATRAALLAKTGRYTQSAAAYRHAIATAPGQAEALFLERRLAALPQ
ncbi:RNA polymerase sigma factor [Tritonibacter horizontis]|uniref:RNA polymerase sigma factor n=1 Tax=Tritonibacter horizontis TaxID=1768241 RepID=A0A132C224_9RHOB|nr:RNA polymerase sigma factor [Tritonibacter horizontis]